MNTEQESALDRFSALPIEEQEQILEERDRLAAEETRQKRNLAIGRALGAKANKEQAAERRDFWEKTARRFLAMNPDIPLEDVAAFVRDKALEIGFVMNSGRPHRARTIHKYLATLPEFRQARNQSQDATQ